MRKLTLPLILTVLLTIGLGGCRLDSLISPRLGASPAPTALPLPTATVEPPQPSPTGSLAPPTSTPQTIHSEVVLPTRVMAPQHPLNLPPGFGVSLFAGGLQEPRMLALGPDGEIYAVERGAGRIIRLPDRDGDGVADRIETAAEDLNRPSGLAFHPDGSLYAAETTRVYRLTDPDGDGFFQQREIILDQLPSGGHDTRTILFSPDGTHLYLSIGSSCNVCREDDYRRAAILRYRPDGTGEEMYADGLRNAVGLRFQPGTGALWVTNNGRDWMGDDQPPETVYRLQPGDDAGWPWCHAGRIIDPDYGEPGNCEGKTDPVIEMQAHSAPLGLTFYQGEQFPVEYQGDLLIAFHGSWNRSTPTGYKVVRVPFSDGTPGEMEDFLTGWLLDDGTSWGRPVDVITGPDGSLLISDDGGGKVFRVFYHGSAARE